MKPKFVGNLNWAPQDIRTPYLWRLEEPFGLLTSDNKLVISPPWIPVNGASIPKFAWGIIGHPFENGNKFWSVSHDMGYDGKAIVVDMELLPENPEFTLMTYNVRSNLPLLKSYPKRKWWDKVVMMDGMKLCNENKIKRAAVYSMVRLWGRWCCKTINR